MILENQPRAKRWKKTGKADTARQNRNQVQNRAMGANYASGRIDCSELDGRIGVAFRCIIPREDIRMIL